jgi:thiamine phosphate synthase YjbQ (UPF0047 family)
MDSVELSVDTTGRPFLDLTGEARRFCRDVAGGDADGLLSVFAPHATAGVALFETSQEYLRQESDDERHQAEQHNRHAELLHVRSVVQASPGGEKRTATEGRDGPAQE